MVTSQNVDAGAQTNDRVLYSFFVLAISRKIVLRVGVDEIDSMSKAIRDSIGNSF